MSIEEATAPSEPDTTVLLADDGRKAGPRVRVEVAGRTDAGKVRSNNEDHFLVARLAKSMTICATSLPGEDGETRFSGEEGYLMVVADGMGGAAAGERASALAVASVEGFVLNTLKWFLHLGRQEEGTLFEELRQGLERADQAVVERARADASLRGMGTTVTMAYSVGTDLFLVHAGDSRAYLFHDGTLEQLTSDHTLVQVLVSGGVITPEAARHHRNRHVVTNVVGGPREGVFAEIHKLTVADGDVLLLCSDGLSEPVPDEMIAEIVALSDSAESAASRLVERALERGGPDNVTAVVARFQVG
jgi:protein phosphatase